MQLRIAAYRAPRAVTATALLSVIAVAHGLLQFVLYRNRVIAGSSASDLVVFGLPALAAFAVFAATFRWVVGIRWAGTFLGSLATTSVSFGFAMVASLNIYGS